MPNHAPKHYSGGFCLGAFLGDLGQIEKVSYIKPPLNVSCGTSE